MDKKNYIWNNVFKIRDGQIAWVEFDKCGELELAKYHLDTNDWRVYESDDPTNMPNDRVKVFYLVRKRNYPVQR